MNRHTTRELRVGTCRRKEDGRLLIHLALEDRVLVLGLDAARRVRDALIEAISTVAAERKES